MGEALLDRNATVRTGVGPEGDEVVPFSASDLTLSTLPPMEGVSRPPAPGEGDALRVPSVEPRMGARRRPRLDLVDLTQIVLVLTSGAVCVDRILWAVRP